MTNVTNSSMTMESFEDLLEESLKDSPKFEGRVVEGTIVGLDNDTVTIDVGLKSEGRVGRREFGSRSHSLALGEKINIFVDRMEDRNGEIVLSFEKARRESAWQELEGAYNDKEKVLGVMTNRVKGGFTVDL